MKILFEVKTWPSATGSFNVAMGFWGFTRFPGRFKQERMTTPADHFL
jgi:hypothetical protein